MPKRVSGVEEVPSEIESRRFKVFKSINLHLPDDLRNPGRKRSLKRRRETPLHLPKLEQEMARAS
jgi:hypothetical protein